MKSTVCFTILKAKLVLCLSLFHAEEIIAKDRLASITATIDTTQLMIGDRATLTVEVNYQKGTKIEWPNIAFLQKDFEVLQKKTSIRTVGSGERQSLVFILTKFTPGNYKINPLPVKVISQKKTYILQSRQLSIIYRTLPVDLDLPFKDIYPSKAFDYTEEELFPYILGIGTLITAFLLLALYSVNTFTWLRLFRLAPRFYRQATASIRKLENKENIHSRLSVILRTYIEKRFAISSKASTTKELLSKLQNENLEDDLLQKARIVFETADRAKFSKEGTLTVEEHILLEEGREFVLATKPIE